MLLPLFSFIFLSLSVWIHFPFLYWWENVLSLLEALAYASCYYLFSEDVKFTFSTIMSEESLKEFNSASKIEFYILSVAVSLSVLCITIRIIKGIIKARHLFRKLFSTSEDSGFRWKSLWELQDTNVNKQLRAHRDQVISTEVEYLNKQVL